MGGIQIGRGFSAAVHVSEVEVDFPTSQASVLFDPAQVNISDLMHAVTQAGYKAAGFTRNESGVN